ncbi:MAG: hypothetical protein ABUL50_01015 [Rhizobacter sp.]
MDFTATRPPATDHAAASTAWLMLDHVTLAYGKKVVVSALNLALPRGAIG